MMRSERHVSADAEINDASMTSLKPLYRMKAIIKNIEISMSFASLKCYIQKKASKAISAPIRTNNIWRYCITLREAVEEVKW